MSHRVGRGTVSMETEMIVMQPQAKECWQPPEVGKGEERSLS